MHVRLFSILVAVACAVLAAVSPAFAQTRHGITFQAGPTVDALGAGAEVLYFSHWSDQWSWEAGAGQRLWFVQSHRPGHFSGMARVRYLLDIFRLLPSFYLGLGAGWMPDEDASVAEIQYGIAVDYMLSRRYQIGLDVSGVTAVFSQEIPDEDGTPVSTATRIQVLFRLQWIWGETW